jgi:acetyl-CoA carboxylase biotin carboxylase subunit
MECTMVEAEFDSVLVANRGEIARRIIRTARSSGIRTIAVHSTADETLPFVKEADVAVCIGDPPPASSYLNVAALLAAAEQTGAGAIHPGYGFLSENHQFAQAVIDHGLTWIGPSPSVIEAMGNKINARNQMQAAGVPVFAGSIEPVRTPEQALAVAEAVGFPLMIKAAAGGGGIGMTVVEDAATLVSSLEAAAGRAAHLFGSGDLLIERFVPSARHVEVQILGLPTGEIVCLGERDCSVQRRHQKVIEEAPAAQLTDVDRAQLRAAAVLAGEVVGYQGAGTVEFLYDRRTGEFSFLEMNTRLQVEHPVTELVTGIDLVAAQLRIAAGRPLDWDPAQVHVSGHALEFRIYAEDSRRLLPSPGLITRWEEPSGEHVRVDSGYARGDLVTPYYDPLLAKVCVWGADRYEALARGRAALKDFVIDGPRTNLDFLLEVLDCPSFLDNTHDTQLVSTLRPRV